MWKVPLGGGIRWVTSDSLEKHLYNLGDEREEAKSSLVLPHSWLYKYIKRKTVTLGETERQVLAGC